MFDVPNEESVELRWSGQVPIEDRPWNVGLIVGPSGCGKSSVMRQMFGDMPELTWSGQSVIDGFAPTLSLQQITDACSAVGFNTIPAWVRPFDVLSNGEKFRADLARRMLELPDPVVVDEFTSVVDRQVAQIGSHAVQKYARKNGRKFVAVTCHYDVIDWLQPDWVLEPATMTFAWRSVQRRPQLDGHVSPVPYSTWETFAPFHYLTADLHRNAKCFTLNIGDRPAAFAGLLHRVHPLVRDIIGVSRLVTLPDWQGLGLAFRLVDTLGAAHKAVGLRLHTYPAHPALIRSFDQSPVWKMTQKPAGQMTVRRDKSTMKQGPGGRPCAVFEYVGPAMNQPDAERLLDRKA